MTFAISTNVIIDTVQALAAFESLTAGPDGAGSMDPLLAPVTRGALRLMVKNAFADTVMAIAPWVERCSLDGETPGEPPAHQEADDSRTDLLLTVDLRLPSTLAGTATALRRSLEHTVAMHTMRLHALAASDTLRAAAYEALASKALTTLLSTFTAAPAPFLRMHNA